MLRTLSKKFCSTINENPKTINTETTGKINSSEIPTDSSRKRNKFYLPLNLRIKIRNLLPIRYPLTTILIGLNIYKYTSKEHYILKFFYWIFKSF